jgi:hypothetical protein
MAVWVAEALPPSEQIEGVITISPSLSPGYPLEDALTRTRRGIVNFYSERDWFILGVGTTISGTMDGHHTSSAGRLGFEPPPYGLPAKLYEHKLFQIPWQPSMAEVGNRGLHLTSGARLFVASYVAPLVLAQHWDRSLVEVLTSQPPHPLTSAPTRPAIVGRPATRPTTRPATRPTTHPATRPSTRHIPPRSAPRP